MFTQDLSNCSTQSTSLVTNVIVHVRAGCISSTIQSAWGQCAVRASWVWGYWKDSVEALWHPRWKPVSLRVLPKPSSTVLVADLSAEYYRCVWNSEFLSIKKKCRLVVGRWFFHWAFPHIFSSDCEGSRHDIICEAQPHSLRTFLIVVAT